MDHASGIAVHTGSKGPSWYSSLIAIPWFYCQSTCYLYACMVNFHVTGLLSMLRIHYSGGHKKEHLEVLSFFPFIISELIFVTPCTLLHYAALNKASHLILNVLNITMYLMKMLNWVTECGIIVRKSTRSFLGNFFFSQFLPYILLHTLSFFEAWSSFNFPTVQELYWSVSLS